MRGLVQPGPVHPARFDSFQGEPLALNFTLSPGQSLNKALTAPLIAAGMQSATVSFGGGALAPFHYVMPGPPDSALHVAYFTAPRAPAGETRVEAANATFGWDEGKPFVHIHGAWTEANGIRHGGHMLPHDCIVAREMPAQACGFTAIRMATAADPETNFTLFQPSGCSTAHARGVVARIRPNADISLATEAIAQRHGLRNAAVRGSLGSLIGARFTDGRTVTDDATEVLVRRGAVRDGVAEFEMLVADMQGNVHQGLLVRGDNPVLITFDLVLESLD
jgi:predicted DNA-binding protein with PD1-like motif